MLTFAQAESMYRPGRQNKLGNNIYLERLDDDTYAVRLHRTNVVTIRRDGRYQLNTGGYRSYITKDRINEYGPIRVYQKAGDWYYGEDRLFESGMVWSVPEKRRVD